MPNPNLITHYEVYSPGPDTSTLVTPTFSPNPGEVIVVKLSTWSTLDGMDVPTGGGQTYQAAQIAAPGGFKGWSGTYVCTVGASPGTFAVSCAPLTANNTRHSMVVERWSNATVAATPAVLTTTTGSGGDMVSSITTTAANSVCTWSMCDLNSRDPVSRVYTPGTTVEDGMFDGHVGSNSVQYFAYAPLPTAGANAIGVAVPAGALAWAASGVELLATTTTIVDLAATFTASGNMTVALDSEVDLAATFTATGSMSATLTPDPVDLAANFTASGTMTATLNVPVIGPVDPIATPVANALLACLTSQMNELPSPPSKIELRAGAESGPLIGPNVDECCAGLAWVRVASVYPSWDSFPSPDNTWLPCGPLAYAVVLEMGSAFCMPWSDSDQEWDNMDPPSTADWETAHITLMQHQTLMRRAAACCFAPTQRRAVGEWNPLSVEGGCLGGTIRVTVSVMAPCGDC